MKNISAIVWVVAVIIILGVLIWWGGGDKAALPTDDQLAMVSALITNNTSHDFGRINMGDGEVRTNFIVSNPTAADVRVDSLVTSCMCTLAYIVNGDDKKGPYGMPGHSGVVPRANEIIKAGGEMMVEVVFDPAAHGPEGAGMIERDIYVVDDQGKTLNFKIKAEVVL